MCNRQDRMGGINMEEFNLEEYLANPSRKIVTREGKPARIVCTDAKFEKYQVLALITKEDGQEMLATLETSGKFRSGYNSHLDLFFAPEKHEGWINVYRDTDTGTTSFGVVLYASRKEAEEVGKSDDYYVATTKIEWEE